VLTLHRCFLTPFINRNTIFTFLVSVSGGVILWADNQTTTLLCTSVDGLNDIDQLLLVFQNPVQLIVVSRTEIAHHMLVSEEEHEGDGIVELVHLLEVGNLVKIADIDDSEVLDSISDTVKDLILTHAVWIPVTSEADYDKTLFFRHDGLVDVPAGDEMGENDGTHVEAKDLVAGDEVISKTVCLWHRGSFV